MLTEPLSLLDLRTFNSESWRAFMLKPPCNDYTLDRMFPLKPLRPSSIHDTPSAPLLTSANGIVWQPPPHTIHRAPSATPQVTKPALKDVVGHPLATLLAVDGKIKPSPILAVVSTLMVAGDVVPEPLSGSLDITACETANGHCLSSVEEALFDPLGAVAILPWHGAYVTKLCRARTSKKSLAP